MTSSTSVLWFDEVKIEDVPKVGGKNASLGEMYQTLSQRGVSVPFGFATTAQAFRDFINDNNLKAKINDQLAALSAGKQSLAVTGQAIRGLVLHGEFSEQLKQEIVNAYQGLCEKVGIEQLDVAVRSSATAEDLPQASFAGQQESYLNIRGEDQLLEACRRCYASLFTDRAITYREEMGFDHDQVALSVGVQQMVRSQASGVMFTLDTETGFPDAVLINAAWGLGETVVQGSVNPDRYMVYKPLLDKEGLHPLIEKQAGDKLVKMIYSEGTHDPTKTIETTPQERDALVLNEEQIMQLAGWAKIIEDHYKHPMDIEWALDERNNELYIVQARPETIESQKNRAVLVNYSIKERSTVLCEGSSVGGAIGTGPVVVLDNPSQEHKFPDGAILVAERTDPDWLPIMRRSSGIITNSGGPTSHAAIVSRELKVPAIVGTGNATTSLQDEQEVTICCSDGAVGKVYEGILAYETEEILINEIPETDTKILINAAMPDGAMHWWQLPVKGIGLTRIEFIISSQIRVHPMALLHPEKVTDKETKKTIRDLTKGYDNAGDFFSETLARGLGKIAASRYPDPVIVRMSDFKSNEYRGLVGGEFFELMEDNPMLGVRGASRYYSPLYKEAFQLECRAIKFVREEMGFDNIIVMIPFCRTLEEADRVTDTMKEAGLVRGENGLQMYVMCEIPSNVILAAEFCERFDGFSIGSNDLTQLVLGIDRDSQSLSGLFDTRNEAVKRMIKMVIEEAHKHGRKVGICGQAPSDHPEFAEFLVECGIDTISLNPDSVVQGSKSIALAESRIKNK